MSSTIEADVVVLGAGPAGLSAAQRLAAAGKSVIVVEKAAQVGGISKTIRFRGCSFDLGGHRFYTKLPEVMALWEKTLGDDFLVRPRLSRIYYRNRFFDYPLKPLDALFGLGILESLGVISSYVYSRLFPYKSEENFEQWVSNRFGRRLYRIFFKNYTEKLWGIPCTELRSEWSAQRIGKLSLLEAIRDAFSRKKGSKVKSLIDTFRYPKYGPGMMYERMAQGIADAGGEVTLRAEVVGVERAGNGKLCVVADTGTGMVRYVAASVVSTIPIDELLARISPPPDPAALEAVQALRYRSLVVVNIILDGPNPFPDNWIYVHTPGIRLGRIQNFGNWSPYMVDRPERTSLGLEFFCDEGDDFWNLSDADLIECGLGDVVRLKLVRKSDFVDGFVCRVPKAYPVYDREYATHLNVVRAYLGSIGGLQTVGRGGMFRYNGMDHSVLAGLWAAENILGRAWKDPWEIKD